ncbi:hypothetical protein DEU56DRAFT_980376 [Suillus clintonianus]|uniref:uncharacterized protein n=1 Tax=Suillus clintonianus TaxID=1904413 RepID=UPI001B8725D8|nr:uncharacterized protein DEU56DRAFT_980376 [Suillus clintonianus]KAG2138975.1 hypothetical protein DEU56DRAFT_980376 [Suillus clintonianus]
MQKTVLPLGLLDFSLAHVRPANWGCRSRNLHQAVALAPSPSPSFEPAEDKSVFSRRRRRGKTPGNLTIRASEESISSPMFKLPKNFTSPMSELERRVLAFQTIQVPLDATDSQSLETPGSEAAPFPRYTDEELFSMYEDLLDTTLAQQPVEVTESSVENRDTPAMIEVRQRVRICVREEDLSGAESAIRLAKDSGIIPPEDSINMVLGYHALHGNIERFEGFMANILSEKPSETQRDLHIKSYLRDPIVFASRTFPTRGIDLLHKYEASGLHPPMKSYTRIISSLFSVRPSPSSPSILSTPDVPLGRLAAHSQAWDLFAHMRYVAHPTPDAHLYALMIRACGSAPLSPEPERALDLWTEMLEAGIVPTKGAYDAVIRACAKAGGEWVSEAIRFARQMRNRFGGSSSEVGGGDLQGIGGPRTWTALLDGCKRVGDLGRARWILAEAVRAEGLNEEMMQHMFHTYAAYRPPFKRGATRIVDDGAVVAPTALQDQEEPLASATEGSSDSPSVSADASFDSDALPTDLSHMDTMPSFSHLPPQSPGEVLAEARALFDRILQDTNITSHSSSSAPVGSLAGKFNVTLTPRLLNAYLSVYYSHASIENSCDVFDRLFSSYGVGLVGDSRTYVDALERCALSRPRERDFAGKWVDELWTRWEELERGWVNGDKKSTVTARLVERAHTAVRRVYLLNGNVDRAIALVRTFMSRYPPTALLPPTRNPSFAQIDVPSQDITSKRKITLFAKPPILSTRTVLSNPSSTPRPLVRLTSAIGPPDERVPPLLSFADVELLHTRLVEQGRGREVGFLKWACKAYEGALRTRREAVLGARVPVGDDVQ